MGLRETLFWLVHEPGGFRILTGLNQAIMATLSMVIFAAAIGGFEDIGWEVLRAARKAEFGYGIIAGIIITLLAVLLDRVTAVVAGDHLPHEPGCRLKCMPHARL